MPLVFKAFSPACKSGIHIHSSINGLFSFMRQILNNQLFRGGKITEKVFFS